MLRENEYRATAGLPTVFFQIVLGLLALAAFSYGGRNHIPAVTLTALGVMGLVFLSVAGLFIVNPGEAKALQLFGEYKGTVRTQGFWFANPFLTKKTISLRIRNFETAKLKVNDKRANPIEIAAIVVWKVVDTAEALFEVDSYSRRCCSGSRPAPSSPRAP